MLRWSASVILNLLVSCVCMCTLIINIRRNVIKWKNRYTKNRLRKTWTWKWMKILNIKSTRTFYAIECRIYILYERDWPLIAVRWCRLLIAQLIFCECNLCAWKKCQHYLSGTWSRRLICTKEDKPFLPKTAMNNQLFLWNILS